MAAPGSGSSPENVWTPLVGSSISCCCPAAPKVQVVMPRSADRAPVELLLCGHHYRAASQALQAAGATVFDVNGMPLVKPVVGQLERPTTPARIGS